MESDMKDTSSHNDILRGRLAFNRSLNPLNAFCTARIISDLKYSYSLFILILWKIGVKIGCQF